MSKFQVFFTFFSVIGLLGVLMVIVPGDRISSIECQRQLYIANVIIDELKQADCPRENVRHFHKAIISTYNDTDIKIHCEEGSWLDYNDYVNMYKKFARMCPFRYKVLKDEQE